jgi:molybdopterin converting factor small subunit
MNVKIRAFYPDLQRLFDDPDEVRVEGLTVGECLTDLVSRYPGAGKLLFDTRGKLLKHVHVFVNAEGMFKPEMTKQVRDGDQLIIAVMAIGG